MLSNLASYLGYGTPSGKTPRVENASSEMRLRAVEEDEWVLVERNENEGNISKKEIDEDAEMTRVTLAASTHPSFLTCNSSKGLSRSASLDILNPLQESWYLTPPPTFTSEGPVHMETSPLENLLIEHPSMSVYERTQRPDTSRKMSNSSPSSTAPSEEEHPVKLMPIKEKMYKLPRNKLNVKLSKKQSSTNQSPKSLVPLETEELDETKEPKIKNFVKSPRRSINSEFQSPPKKAFRKRPETSTNSEMISKSSTSEKVIREEKSPVIPNVPPRRLYSEVLASKPNLTAVQTPTQTTEPPKPEASKSNLKSVAEAGIPETPEKAPAAVSEETVMSVEESVEEIEEETSESPDDRDRRRVVQTLPDQKHRLHFLSRSAQKVSIK